MDLSFRLVRACAFAERVASLFLSNHTNWTLGNSPEPAEANSLRNPWAMREPCTVPSPHQYDGMLTFATNCLGRNVANASWVSPSRNEQSSGCSH